MTGQTAKDVLGPLQAALYALLDGDENLTDLLGHTGDRNGVYDDVPENVVYPYVDLGETVSTPRNTHDGFGAESLVTLHVYVKARGNATAFPIVNRIRALLDEQHLAVAGHTVVSVRHEQTQTLRDPNPGIRHLPVRIRITTEQE